VREGFIAAAVFELSADIKADLPQTAFTFSSHGIVEAFPFSTV
jgi:hypothetical protein